MAAETIIRTIGIICIIASAPWVAHWFTNGSHGSTLIRWYSLTLIAGIPYGCCSALLRLYNKFALHGQADAITALIELVGILVVWQRGATLDSVCLVLVAGVWAKTILMVICTYRATGGLLRSGWRISSWKDLYSPVTSFGRFLFFSNCMGIVKGIQSNGDTLIIGCFLSPLYVGYYRLAKQVSQIFTLPGGTFYLVAFPEMAKAWQHHGVDKLRRSVKYFTAMSTAVMLLLLVPTLAIGEWSIGKIAGDEFVGSWPAARILLFGTLVYVASNYSHAALVVAGSIQTASNIYLFGAVIHAMLLVVLTPLYSIEGAAWSFVVFGFARLLLLSHYLSSSTFPPPSFEGKGESIQPVVELKAA